MLSHRGWSASERPSDRGPSYVGRQPTRSLFSRRSNGYPSDSSLICRHILSWKRISRVCPLHSRRPSTVEKTAALPHSSHEPREGRNVGWERSVMRSISARMTTNLGVIPDRPPLTSPSGIHSRKTNLPLERFSSRASLRSRERGSSGARSSQARSWVHSPINGVGDFRWRRESDLRAMRRHDHQV